MDEFALIISCIPPASLLLILVVEALRDTFL